MPDVHCISCPLFYSTERLILALSRIVVSACKQGAPAFGAHDDSQQTCVTWVASDQVIPDNKGLMQPCIIHLCPPLSALCPTLNSSGIINSALSTEV